MSMICPYCNGLPCTCGTSRPIVSAAQSPQPCRHGIFSHRVCETCKETAQLESELTALRSQVAELQRQLKYERDNPTFDGRLDSWQAACGRARQENEDWEKKCAELQRQLDEQAKQDPVAWMHTLCMEGGQENIRLSLFDDHSFGVAGKDYSSSYEIRTEPLYALPPNLPAMIEQERAEEREACAKACHGQADAGDCEEAIRARGEK